jgi:hypothetical protein
MNTFTKLFVFCIFTVLGALFAQAAYVTLQEAHPADLRGEEALLSFGAEPLSAQAAAAGFYWDQETIADVPGDYISMQLNPADEPRVAYYTDGLLYYAYRQEAGWVSELVDRGVVWDLVTLRLDQEENPHILYSGAGNILRYASLSGSTWITETVTSGFYSRLDLDSQDNPHLVFYDSATQGIYYASKQATTWDIQEVMTTTRNWSYPAIALDEQDGPHLCMDVVGNSLTYAFRTGSAWEFEVIEAEQGSEFNQCSITLDSYGEPHVGYHKAPDGLVGYMMYAHQENGTWQVKFINYIGAGDANAIALDSQDHPHLSYYQNGGDWGLYYSYHDGVSWLTEQVGGGDFIRGSSIAINQLEEPLIARTSDWGYLYLTRQPVQGHVQAHANESTPGGYIPCSGVTVAISGTQNSVITDDYGQAWLLADPGTYDIVFSKPEFISITKRNEAIYENQTTHTTALMIRQECWGADQSCFNELVNVVPVWGIASEATGFYNSLCEFTERMQNGDALGAMTVLLPNVVDLIDIPIVADAADIVQGFFSCLEGVIYETLEELCGVYADTCTQTFSKLLWGEIKLSQVPLVIITEMLPPQEQSAQVQADPLEVHLYSGGNHLGMSTGALEHTLPYSYLFRAGGKYQIAVVKEAYDLYDLELVGNGPASYRVTIINPQNDGSGTQVSYQNLQIDSGTVASLQLGLSVNDYTLAIDNDGDGTPDQYQEPGGVMPVGGSALYLPMIIGGQ